MPLGLIALDDLVGLRRTRIDRHRSPHVRAFVELALRVTGTPRQILDAVLAVVHRDPIQPRGKRRIAAEVTDRLEHADEDFLRHVLRFRLVAEHARQQAIDRALMAQDQLVERSFVAALQPCDQAPFVVHHAAFPRFDNHGCAAVPTRSHPTSSPAVRY